MTPLLQAALALGAVLAAGTAYMYWHDWRHRDHADKSHHPAE